VSGPVQVHELVGEVNGIPVHIDVACVRGDLYLVAYAAQVSSDEAASASFDSLRSSAAEQLGTAEMQSGTHGRRAEFGCTPSAPRVALVEELMSRGAPRPGAALIVVPGPGVC
jgi:hypothetical protein